MKKLLIGSTIVLALAGTTSYNLTRPISADTDLPLKVQQQGEVLDNHEARITNTENDVKDLQSNTNTPPSSTRFVAPTPSNPPALQPESTQPVQSNPKVKVVSASQRIEEEPNQKTYYCDLTYSDGTTESRREGVTLGQATYPDNCQSYVGKEKGSF